MLAWKILEISALSHDLTLDYWREKYGLCYKKKSAFTKTSLELLKVELGLNLLTKTKRWRNFTYDSWLTIEKLLDSVHFIP